MMENASLPCQEMPNFSQYLNEHAGGLDFGGNRSDQTRKGEQRLKQGHRRDFDGTAGRPTAVLAVQTSAIEIALIAYRGGTIFSIRVLMTIKILSF
jgi:hypothetical protein